MTGFTDEQWIVLLLVFLLGVVLGMYFLSSGKWKRRYRDEVARADTLEAENRRLRTQNHEMTSLRGAAVKHPVDQDRERGPI